MSSTKRLPCPGRNCRGSSCAAASRARWAGWRSSTWASVIEYPLNIGGRPFASWVSFVIPAYETTILLASLTAVIGMIALNGLPLPYHPVFNVPEFSSASGDRFFLTIETSDPKFDAVTARRFLETLHPLGVYDVAA